MKFRTCIGCNDMLDDPKNTVTCPRCRIQRTPPPRKYRILLIDDDRLFLRDLKDYLEDTLYYEVQTASDSDSGLERIDESDPELIILAAMMPEINGNEFIKKLRSIKKTKKTPIIITSASESIKRFFEPWNIQGFVNKPVNMKHLLELLRSNIDTEVKNN